MRVIYSIIECFINEGKVTEYTTSMVLQNIITSYHIAYPWFGFFQHVIQHLAIVVLVCIIVSCIRHWDFRPSSSVTLRPPPLKFETWWSGDLWSKTNFPKGNRAFADLRYREKYSISPSKLIFAATKGTTVSCWCHCLPLLDIF